MSSQWPPSFRYTPFGLQIGAPQRSWGKHHLLIQLGGQKWHHLSDRVHEPIMNQSLEIPFLSAEANSKFRLSGWAHFNQHCLLTWVAWWLTLQSSISLHREVHNKNMQKTWRSSQQVSKHCFRMLSWCSWSMEEPLTPSEDLRLLPVSSSIVDLPLGGSSRVIFPLPKKFRNFQGQWSNEKSCLIYD